MGLADKNINTSIRNMLHILKDEEPENDEMRNGRFKKDSTQASRVKNKVSKINTLVGYNNKLDTREEKGSEV